MIYVLGNINKEVLLEVPRLPKKDEAVSAESCRTCLGGKGANQAIAIAKLGRRDDVDKKTVALIGKIGDDGVGAELKARLDDYGVDTEFVRSANRSTGVVFVTSTGKDSRIVHYGGANNMLSKTDVDEALENASEGDTLLCQLESPLYVVAYALRKAKQLGMTTILNPSPAKELPDDLYYNVDIIVPNRAETKKLVGIDPSDESSKEEAIRRFHEKGVQHVVITLGKGGAIISDGHRLVGQNIPRHKVTPIDTTCAGDTFVGALALTYPHVGMYSFKEACLFATRAAALCITKQGAAESVPSFEEVLELYNNIIG